MKTIESVNGVSIEVVEHEGTWAVSNKQVAAAFGVAESTIRSQKNEGATEYKEGVHFFVDGNPVNGNLHQVTYWTKKGVITLGFKLRETPQTIAFRDWASDYIINGGSSSEPMTIVQLLEQNVRVIEGLQKNVTALEHKIAEDKPLVSFAKSVEASVDSVLISNYAKLLSESEGVKVGPNNLMAWLRDNGYLITGGNRHNAPKQKYIDNGWFEVTTRTFAGSTGTHQRFTPKITGKGQIALVNKIVGAFTPDSKKEMAS